MNLPKIELAALPGVDTLTGVFGNLAHQAQASDDTIIDIMEFIYNLIIP